MAGASADAEAVRELARDLGRGGRWLARRGSRRSSAERGASASSRIGIASWRVRAPGSRTGCSRALVASCRNRFLRTGFRVTSDTWRLAERCLLAVLDRAPWREQTWSPQRRSRARRASISRFRAARNTPLVVAYLCGDRRPRASDCVRLVRGSRRGGARRAACPMTQHERRDERGFDHFAKR